ncbi:uncharacterized protein [Drosophila kikkawai]|uniref:Uncharacterized protein n=1 Tax=Drosophila kikkawai TaxID=30033 RepID=A0A6P4JUZ4_DROKI|nr:uncharacterized protein LOC108086139 [Drosophila kikkawai]KAH8333846.1 hypothetical protein KR059_003887 [Drosophila kikkawai]
MTTSAEKPREIGFDKQFATDVNGVPTEIVFQRFGNKWFLLATQFGKMPGIYNVQFDVERQKRILPSLQNPYDNPEFHRSVPITMTVRLGLDTDEIRSAIQFLINKTELNECPTQIEMALGLKQIDGPNLRALAKVINEEIFLSTNKHK